MILKKIENRMDFNSIPRIQVSQGVRRMLNKQILDTVTESQRVVRKCEVTAILILYGLPRYSTSSSSF